MFEYIIDRTKHFVIGLNFAWAVSDIRMIAESRHSVYLSVLKHCSLFYYLWFSLEGVFGKQGSWVLGFCLCSPHMWHDFVCPPEESCQEKSKSLGLRMFSGNLSLDVRLLETYICLQNNACHIAALSVLDQLVDEADLSAFGTKVSIKSLSTALNTYWMGLHNVNIL